MSAPIHVPVTGDPMDGKARVRVIGGGLSGCEAALQLADAGMEVELWEMRPKVTTPAHKTDGLAELVCSNSFKGLAFTSAHGLFKEELRLAGSRMLPLAFGSRVPAGESLAIDRQLFSDAVEKAVKGEQLPKKTIVKDQVFDQSTAKEVIGTRKY